MWVSSLSLVRASKESKSNRNGRSFADFSVFSHIFFVFDLKTSWPVHLLHILHSVSFRKRFFLYDGATNNGLDEKWMGVLHPFLFFSVDCLPPPPAYAGLEILFCLVVRM